MIKDLLVVISGFGETVGPYALALARVLDASVSCLCLRGEPDDGALALAEVRPDLVVAAREEARQAAQPAAENLAYRAEGLGMRIETETLGAGTRCLRDQLLARTRTHDLVLVEAGDAFLDDVLIRSGRPVLVVPKRYGAAPQLDAITVAWDGSAAAARAVAGAIPFLARASRVCVVTVETEALEEVGRQVDHLLRHLERHGIAAAYRARASLACVADTLLAEAGETESDLLVMGAYGHSHLRERILGGTSQAVLRDATVPVLMSH